MKNVILQDNTNQLTIDDVIHFFKEKGISSECPCCGDIKGIITTKNDNSDEVEITPPPMRAVCLWCYECGYIRLFSVAVISDFLQSNPRNEK